MTNDEGLGRVAARDGAGRGDEVGARRADPEVRSGRGWTAAGRATTRTAGSAGRWVPAFVVLSGAWGSSFALIKIAVEAGMAPLWVAFWRCFLGAVTLWLLSLVLRARPLADRAAWGHVAVVGLLLNAVPFALFAYGETHVSSVVAGVWNATTPLTTLMFVMLLLADEHPGLRRICGLLLGLLGVLVVLEVWRGLAGGELLGNLACVGATVCYGAAFAYTRRFLAGRADPAVSLAAAQVSCATVELLVVTPVLAGAPAWPGWGPAAGLLVLGALGTGIAYVLNLRVVRAAGSTVASTVTYLTPLWSTLLGALLLSERVSWATVAGGVVVILGVVLTRSGGTRPARRPEAPAATRPATR